MWQYNDANTLEDPENFSTILCLRLEKRDPERNQARFYTVTVICNLFGEWTLMREWGRIGSPGTLRVTIHGEKRESDRTLRRIFKEKRRKGYRLIRLNRSDLTAENSSSN
ncbi:MAG: WGR domain-containing protein [Magnetococcales bacterium]|nr:WGR domain-containing protein [Magnetococcales bacterium]